MFSKIDIQGFIWYAIYHIAFDVSIGLIWRALLWSLELSYQDQLGSSMVLDV